MRRLLKRLKVGLLDLWLKGELFLTARGRYKFLLKEWSALTDIEALRKVLDTKRFTRNLRPIELPYPRHKKILVIAPHPDDDILGAGGTLMKAVDSGAKVDILYIANGNSQRAELIKDETRAVCRSINTTPHFLDFQNGRIPLHDDQTNGRILSLIRELAPDAIFITFLADDHDDHRRVNHLLFNILNGRKIAAEIWAYQIYSTIIPNVVVNITEKAKRKRELLGMWKSVSGTRDWAHYMLGINASNCRFIGTKEPVYAEGFFVVPIEEYLKLCSIYFTNDPSKIYYGDHYKRPS